jgi:hypothetical protein
MTKRKRTTWKRPNQKSASPPPATPGYAEYWGDGAHPAAQQDPNADDYKNGDTSSWAEDVHPGPYTNGTHPATPPGDFDHPAQKRAAMQWAEKKAAKCLHIAGKMLGRTASVKSVEKQAFSLMSLPDREIDATLKRMGGGFLGGDDMYGDQSDNSQYYDMNLAGDDEDDMMGFDDEDDMMGFDDEDDMDIMGMGGMYAGDDEDDDMMGFDDEDDMEHDGPDAVHGSQDESHEAKTGLQGWSPQEILRGNAC